MAHHFDFSRKYFFDQKCLQSKKEYSNRQRLKKILTQAKGKQEERKIYQANYCCLLYIDSEVVDNNNRELKQR